MAGILMGVLCLNALAAEVPPGAATIFDGEKLQYAIKKHGIKVGEASLVFKAADTLNGKNVHSIAFTAKSLNFLDEETIYLDPATFLPLRVNRNLNIWGKKEKILEEYLPQEGQIRISKRVGDNLTGQILKKPGNIDNIYCFIYRYRLTGDTTPGSALNLHLPTKDVTIKVLKEDSLKVGKKVILSHFLQSDSKEYKIWLEVNENKTPLRIDGALGIGSASLIIVSGDRP